MTQSTQIRSGVPNLRAKLNVIEPQGPTCIWPRSTETILENNVAIKNTESDVPPQVPF